MKKQKTFFEWFWENRTRVSLTIIISVICIASFFFIYKSDSLLASVVGYALMSAVLVLIWFNAYHKFNQLVEMKHDDVFKSVPMWTNKEDEV